MESDRSLTGFPTRILTPATRRRKMSDRLLKEHTNGPHSALFSQNKDDPVEREEAQIFAGQTLRAAVQALQSDWIRPAEIKVKGLILAQSER